MTLIGMAIAIALPLACMPPMAGCKALLTVRHYSGGSLHFPVADHYDRAADISLADHESGAG